MKKKSIILLSGGLDSLVCLDIASKNTNVKLALFFDYGQKALDEEYIAANEISKFYNIKLEKIELPFLKNIINTQTDDTDNDWIPNRNGLFLNIAACYCDKNNWDYIVFGANKEESIKFPDNSKRFIEMCQNFFEYSTLRKTKIFAPCANFDKISIVNYAIDNNLPFNLLKSCYDSSKTTGKKHCGDCASCKLLKEAILNSKKPELIKELF